MKDKKILLAVILTSVFLIITGITYAYFSLVVSGNDVAETINVSTTKIELIYTDGNEIKVDSIEPKWTTTKTITVENAGNEEAYYALGWQKLYNEIQKEELVIRSTCTSSGATGGTCLSTDNVVIPQTSEVTAETNTVLYPYKENVKILPGEKHTYTVTIEFINYEDKAQNYNQGKRFYGVLGAAESSKIITLSDVCQNTTLASCLKDNYELAGLTEISQAATGNQNYDTTEYRYQGGSGCYNLEMTEAICVSMGGAFIGGLGGANDAECYDEKYNNLKVPQDICINNGGSWSDNMPNNYITFNNESGVWRIIGVFEVETPSADGTYIKENKVKIVRDKTGNVSWDYRASSGYKSDWTTSTLMTMLNTGPYYNRTSGYTQLACSTGYDTTVNNTAVCDYTNNGLTSEAKNQISNTKWYLGNVVYNYGYGTTKEIYTQERSTSVHSGNKQTWDGKVALIYPSDYMYVSSVCYNDDTMKGYNTSALGKDYRSETCKSTNWLFDRNNWFWAVSPSSSGLRYAMYVSDSGYVSYSTAPNSDGGLRQSVYLDSSVKYIGGDGTAENPFVIQ